MKDLPINSIICRDAAHAGRNFIGIESYPDWYNISLERIRSLDGSTQPTFLKEE